jgi:hypothetical protein
MSLVALSVVALALGVPAGLLGARGLRHCHLHWSWAVIGLGSVLLARPLLTGATGVLEVAALTAAVRGRRWQREDLLAGGDLAEVAGECRRPHQALCAGTRALGVAVARWRADTERPSTHATSMPGGRPGASPWCAGGELAVGRDRRGRAVSIELGGVHGGAHTLVVGATGSGKTVTQMWIATQAIAHGMAAVVVDPKGDRALRTAVRDAAWSADRRYLEWSPRGPTIYNPYAQGGETEIADKALAGERYTEPHYQRQAQRYLGHAVRVLRGTGEEVSLTGIVQMLDPAELELRVRALPEPRARPVHAYLDSLTARQRTELAGVRDRLAIMVESDVGPWLDPRTGEHGCNEQAPDPGERAAETARRCERTPERFDLLSALRERAVVYFDLRADSRPLLAEMLGAAIVQDLLTAVSALQAEPVAALLAIDEFAAVAAEHVARLFGRARAAGASLLLGVQELSDLRLPWRETLLEQVLGNLTTVIAHRQAVPTSAELIARLAGSRGAWRTSFGSDGRSSRTRVREPLLDSEQVMRLDRGRAAVIRLAGRGGVSVAGMFAPQGDP